MLISGDGRRASKRCEGFALLLILAVVVVIGAGTFFAAASFESVDRQANVARAHALAEARRAVILYAVAQGDSADRAPGALICVDASAPGDPVQTNATGPGYRDLSPCNDDSGVAIGRLPVRDLGLDPAASGPLTEIWYAIDLAYRDREAAMPINPATSVGLSVDGEAGFAAVLLLPSEPTSNQQRPSSEPADYLAEVNHGDDTEFIDCSALPADDDVCRAPGDEPTAERVIGISIDALFAPVQKRLLAATGELLDSFHQQSAVGESDRFLPWASRLGSAPAFECEPGLVLGHLALANTADEDCADDAYLGGDFAGAFADWSDDNEWIVDNDWLDFIVYHADPACAPDARDCANAATDLDDASDPYLAVLGGAGRELAGQDRGSGAAVADYLDRAPNVDNDPESPGTPGTYRNLRRTLSNNDVFRGLR